jgi:hypothetical protein
MRQLELACIKGTRSRSATQPVAPLVPLALQEEAIREALRLMARAILAVARSQRESSDER